MRTFRLQKGVENFGEFHLKVTHDDDELRTLSDTKLADCINLDITTTKADILETTK